MVGGMQPILQIVHSHIIAHLNCQDAPPLLRSCVHDTRDSGVEGSSARIGYGVPDRGELSNNDGSSRIEFHDFVDEVVESVWGGRCMFSVNSVRSTCHQQHHIGWLVVTAVGISLDLGDRKIGVAFVMVLGHVTRPLRTDVFNWVLR